MSAIEPIETSDYDGRKVRKYNVPDNNSIDHNEPVVMLDISDGEYNAEWYTNIGVQDFVDIGTEHLSESTPGFAAFETGCKGVFREEGKLNKLLSDNENYFPDECSYLRFEGSEYIVGWDRGEDSNSIILLVHSHDTNPLEAFLSDIPPGGTERMIDHQLEQAKQVLQNDP